MTNIENITELYLTTLHQHLSKVERNSSTFEHWESAITEMRKRYFFLIAESADNLNLEERQMVALITQVDRI